MNDNVIRFFERYDAEPALRARVEEAEAAYPGSLEIREAVVEAVLLTHGHPDHVGGAADVAGGQQRAGHGRAGHGWASQTPTVSSPEGNAAPYGWFRIATSSGSTTRTPARARSGAPGWRRRSRRNWPGI